MEKDLKNLRNQIDHIDQEILNLLIQRAHLARDIGKIKTDITYRPEREAQQLRHLISLNSGLLDNTSIVNIFREIISACRSLQKKPMIGFLGPAGTFSQLAALRHFGKSADYLPCKTIEDIFRAAETQQCNYAVVPAENSIEGAVNKTLDLLIQTPLHIIGEIHLPIQQNLLSQTTSLQAIKKIYGHEQSLAQCHQWLNQHVPDAIRIAATSNGEAARLAGEDNETAAIASLNAAELYNLQIVAEHIEDDPNNTTRFLILGGQTLAPSGQDKTSLLLTAPNRAGAVYELLEPLAKYHISMSKFESRPARTGLWKYWFFIDIEGHQEESALAKALAEIKEKASVLKILGSYPRSLGNL
jgi:chorismate mutase/prephenate dehydratase